MLQKYRIQTFSIICLAVTLLLEYFMPAGTYISAGYIFAVIVTVYSPNKTDAVIASVISSIAILIAVFFLHNQGDFATSAINHTFSILGVVTSMFFVLYVKTLQKNAERDNIQVESLFTNATEGIVLANQKGEIELINPFAERMFGYNKDELIGQKIEVLIPRDLHKKHERHREGFHENPINRPMGAGRDLYALKKDGCVFPVEISLSHYKIGRESFATAFIIDITVRKKHFEELQLANQEISSLNVALEQKVKDRTVALHETLSQLEQSKEELSRALEKEKEVSDLKSRFVSTVSHEFRTPLSTILTSASLIRSYKADEEKRERHINRIEESVTHMNAMLEDLLSLGKLEEGLIEVKPDFFSLPTAIADLSGEMMETSRKRNPILYSPDSGDLVYTDKRLIKNILINLISNAIKFSPVDSDIVIKSMVDDNNIIISVADSGIGIAEEDQKHLFERFFRAQNAINIKGTGLGLHIVVKYLELLRGSISIESKLEEGTTFTIKIPNTSKHEEDTGN